MGAPTNDAGRTAASQLQELLEEGVAKGVPGVSAAVATSKGIIWTGTAGKANLGTSEPVRPDMLFGVGSITKTFAAVVILQLVEEGRLHLDDTAAGILGRAVEGVPNADKATVAQLMNHTGGVPSWEDDPVWIREGRGADLDVNRIWRKADTLPYIKGHAPLFLPGAKFSYANTNYTLLGMIIEKVTGQEAVNEIRKRILTPLKLKDIHLEGFEPVPASQLPHRYHWATPDFIKNAGINKAFSEARPGLIDASASNLSVEWTAGGMMATARDLALYGAALRDGKLLLPSSMKFMQSWFPAGDGYQIGHNLFRDQFGRDLSVIGHDGDVLGFTGSLYWIEGAEAVVAVVCNVGSMHSGKNPGVAYSIAKEKGFIAAARQLAP